MCQQVKRRPRTFACSVSYPQTPSSYLNAQIQAQDIYDSPELKDCCLQATNKYAPNAYEDSLVLDTAPDAAAKFEKDRDFSYSASLTVQPEVRWKGSYEDLRVRAPTPSLLCPFEIHSKPVYALDPVSALQHSPWTWCTLLRLSSIHCVSFVQRDQKNHARRHFYLSRLCLVQIEVEAMPEEEALRKAGEEKVNAGLKEVGSLRLVQGRGLKTGDVAVIDIDLRRKESGQIIEGSQQMGKQIDTATAQNTVELPGALTIFSPLN